MQEKIKNNRLLITSVLSVVAMAMTVGAVINYFNVNFNSNNIINFLSTLSIIIAGMTILFFTQIKKEFNLKQLFIPLFLYYIIQCVGDFNSILNNTWSSIYYFALDAGIIILAFLFIFFKVDKIRYPLYCVMIIDILFTIAGVLGGSAYSIGTLILCVVLIGNLYMLDNKEEEKE
ncbi:MAG: hypothetical protein K5892_07980 [Acholeplasmatales bacterium]|nr:hypothetical protein [Acholeplasmatales bacterium]